MKSQKLPVINANNIRAQLRPKNSKTHSALQTGLESEVSMLPSVTASCNNFVPKRMAIMSPTDSKHGLRKLKI